MSVNLQPQSDATALGGGVASLEDKYCGLRVEVIWNSQKGERNTELASSFLGLN